MKNQSAEQVLNEILLRMNYDSRKTLSENREILSEQGGLSAPSILPMTPQQFRQTFPTTSQPTSQQSTQKFNELELGKPKTQEEIQSLQDWLDTYYPTWYKGGKLNQGPGYGTFGPNTTKIWNTNFSVRDGWQRGGWTKPFFDILRKYNISNTVKNGKYDLNFGPRFIGKPAAEQDQLENEVNKYLEILRQKSPNTLNIFSFPDYKLTDTKIKYPKIERTGTDVTRLNRYIPPSQEELQKNRETSAQRTGKIINVGFDRDFEVPSNSIINNWTDEKTNFESFKNSVTLKGFKNDSELRLTWLGLDDRIIKPGGISGFEFKYDNKYFTFKRTFTPNGFLNEFGMIINGQYLPYVKSDFLNLQGFWQENGPMILNLSSIAVAVLGPATWPLLLASAGFDLAAAQMQYEQGDVEGAKLSALLSLTPFLGKFAIKVPKTQADALARKFVNARTEQDVSRIVNSLSQEEINTLKSLRELGDINKVKKMVNDPEVKSAINKAAKESKGIATKSLEKGTYELTTGIGLFFNKLPNLQRQELESLNRKEVINKVINTIVKSTNINKFISEDETVELKKQISTILPIDEFIKECKRKTEIIRKAKQKALEEKNQEILNQSEQTINELEKFIGFLESQPEKLQSGEIKLSNNEIDDLLK